MLVMSNASVTRSIAAGMPMLFSQPALSPRRPKLAFVNTSLIDPILPKQLPRGLQVETSARPAIREGLGQAVRPKPVVFWPAAHQHGACMRLVRSPIKRRNLTPLA